MAGIRHLVRFSRVATNGIHLQMRSLGLRRAHYGQPSITIVRF